jgi:translocation and assembly module TamA
MRALLLLLCMALSAACLLLPGPSLAQDGDDGGYAYEPSLKAVQGALPDALHDLLTSVADAFTMQDSPPASQALLRRRAREDVKTMQQALHSRGYFAGRVSQELRMPQGQEPQLVFLVEPGPLFRFRSVNILFAGPGADHAVPPSQAVLDLGQGTPFVAQKVLDAQSELLERLRNQGHPFPGVQERNVTADHATHSVDVTWRVAPGPFARFGPVRVQGLDKVEEEHVRGYLPWDRGEAFSSRKLENASQELFATGLFSRVEVEPARPAGTANATVIDALPVRVGLSERSHRTVKAGLRYETDTGPGVNLGWEHRNFLGQGETLRAVLDVNQVNRELTASLRKPRFLRNDQSLIIGGHLRDENTEAYDSRSLGAQVLVERAVTSNLTADVGLRYRLARVEDKEDEETRDYGLLSMPAALQWDGTDSPLDPTRGFRATLQGEPFLDTLRGKSHFVRGRLTVSHYLTLLDPAAEDDQTGRLVLALRGSAGSMGGAERQEIPEDELFFAGGGGSVRGYPYQMAGPVDEDGDPVGALSLLEASVELRLRVTKSLGFVAFLDGGRAFEDSVPQADEPLFWGAGIGLRYHTAVGPVRVDVGVPLDRRDAVDESFQLYLSLGQAF